MGYSIFDETMVDMTWPEIEKAAGQGAIVLLPTGIIEEHGPHMGLAVDTYIAYQISKLMKHELEARGIETLIAPPCYWGISPSTGTFAGTFSVRKETMKAIIYDILASLHRWGLNRVFTINWHADYHHCVAILEAIKEAHNDTGIMAYCILTEFDVRRLRLTGEEDYIIVQAARPPQGPPSKYVDLHAGALETGIMLNYFPEQVDAGMAAKLKDTGLTYDDLRGLGRSDEETRKLIPQGYFGNPAGFDIEAGRRFVEDSAVDYASLIDDFMKGNL